MTEMKLTIELVPKTSFYKNMRSHVSKVEWDKIRKRIYNNSNNRCGICKKDNVRLNCHEIWGYDDDKHTQTLLGYIALCTECHFVKHIGLTGILAKQNKLDYNSVINHFCIVNNCNKKVAVDYIEDAFRIWKERSKYEWKIIINGGGINDTI